MAQRWLTILGYSSSPKIGQCPLRKLVRGGEGAGGEMIRAMYMMYNVSLTEFSQRILPYNEYILIKIIIKNK
jgi:hypothetical protein